MKSFYLNLKDKIQALGDTPQEIISNLTILKDSVFVEFLKLLYNEEDLRVLTIKLRRQQHYYKKTQDPFYLVDTQPDSQRTFWDKNRSTSPIWGKMASNAKQSTVSMTFFVSDLKALSQVYMALKTTSTKHDLGSATQKEVDDTYIKRFLNPIADLFRIKITEKEAQKLLSILLKHWHRGKDLEKGLKGFSKSHKLLAHKATLAFNCFQFIHKQHKKDPEQELDILFGKLEFEAFRYVIASFHETRHIAYKLAHDNPKDYAPISIWTMTPHGHAVDAKNPLATSEESVRIFPKDGKLYDIDNGQARPELASTRRMIFKNAQGLSGIIIDTEGHIHIFNHEFGQEAGPRKFHSIVTGGTPVLFAGVVRIEKGKITYLMDNSGHYMPRYTLELLLFLSEKGLLHPDIRFENVGFTSDLFFQLVFSDSEKRYLIQYLRRYGKPGFQRLQALIKDCHKDPGRIYMSEKLIFNEIVYPALIYNSRENPLITWDSTFQALDLTKEALYLYFKDPSDLILQLKTSIQDIGNCVALFYPLPIYVQTQVLEILEGLPRLEDASLLQRLEHYNQYKHYYTYNDLLDFNLDNRLLSSEDLSMLCAFLEKSNRSLDDYGFPYYLKSLIGENILTHPDLSTEEKLYYVDLYAKHNTLEVLEALEDPKGQPYLPALQSSLPLVSRAQDKKPLFGSVGYPEPHRQARILKTCIPCTEEPVAGPMLSSASAGPKL